MFSKKVRSYDKLLLTMETKYGKIYIGKNGRITRRLSNAMSFHRIPKFVRNAILRNVNRKVKRNKYWEFKNNFVALSWSIKAETNVK